MLGSAPHPFSIELIKLLLEFVGLLHSYELLSEVEGWPGTGEVVHVKSSNAGVPTFDG